MAGTITGYEEYTMGISEQAGDSKTSLSMNRQMGSKLEFVRGRAGFMPFAPGGVDNTINAASAKTINFHRDDQGLFDWAPGLSRGLTVDQSVSQETFDYLKQSEKEPDYSETIDSGHIIKGTTIDKGKLDKSKNSATLSSSSPSINDALLDSLLPRDISFGRTALTESVAPKAKEWAHVVDINKNIDNFDELVPNPAKEFPFELDVFQKEAVFHLEQGDSVFVAAHTSAGKTVVAEYAISMANRNMTKAIYTSPIKALSNQKYRDFKQIYDDVGILTGDVQINPEASCLIMTTEILRSMLYRGADLIRDVEFVIFDEVHYVNDQDRGVVWEEVIIMLPDHIKFILLSATVPNTFEFANWVGRTKKKDIYVISTAKRPVPLEHYLWAKNKKFLLVDSEKRFIESAWKSSAATLNPSPPNDAPKGPANQSNSRSQQRGGGGGGGRGQSRGATRARGGGGGRGGGTARGGAKGVGFKQGGGRNINYPGKTTLTQLIQHLHKSSLLPAVIFVFSKKRCEEFATMLTSIDYCSAKEKSEIHMFINKAISRLKPEDRELPQILTVRELLSRGIGIHHGGLLPIVKEVIEILFARTLVKVLFATETFAMGLNLPTRTVVFAGTTKNDGHNFRTLLPGEYTQMAGRAGRRGLDDTGTVILMCNGSEPPPVSELKTMILGNPTKLQSQFRLTYNMILNLLRIEALKVEDMIKRSFSENASQVLLPEQEKSVKLNEASLEKLKRDHCEKCDVDIDKVHELMVKETRLLKDILMNLFHTAIGRKIICPKRIIVYKSETSGEREVGLIMKLMLNSEMIQVLNFAKSGMSMSNTLPFLSFVPGFSKLHLPSFIPNSEFIPKTISLQSIDMITTMVCDTDIYDLTHGDKQEVKNTMNRLVHSLKFQTKWSEVSLERVKDANIRAIVAERKRLIEEISKSQCIHCLNFAKIFNQVNDRFLIKEQIESLKASISDQNLELLPDYEQRIEVLKELNYIDNELNVLLKGRVACEISTGFELIISELVLDNFLGNYEPEEIVALMSCFVFEGNTKKEVETVTPKLDAGRERILDIVGQVNQVYDTYQVVLTQEESEFTEKNRFGLMEAVYEWARGMTFNSITALTDVQEGTIVRVITRLDEICREVMAAARIIGDSTLHDKMAIAQEKIKRDIVFCASLYL